MVGYRPKGGHAFLLGQEAHDGVAVALVIANDAPNGCCRVAGRDVPAHDDLRSATLLSLLAYAGPRPESEALPLRWSEVRKHTILFRATKRGVTGERATRLLGPLRDDLAEWRKASGNPASGAPVIPNRRGKPWSDYDWDNWRERGFRPAARAAGLPAGDADGSNRVRPRDLRSSFATLLIYEGQPPQYVAEQLGHSAATLLRDYARVWQDFDPSQRMSAEEQITRVRTRLQRTSRD
jgi:integrase